MWYPRIVKTFTIDVYLEGGAVLRVNRLLSFSVKGNNGVIHKVEWSHVKEYTGNNLISIRPSAILSVLQVGWHYTIQWRN